LTRVYPTAVVTLIVGEPLVVKGRARSRARSCVFEDDGTTGYFYALDEAAAENRICDAVHIYNASNVTDGAKPSELQISWSTNDRACALIINGYTHAVFDFDDRRGYSRTGFPQTPGTGWSVTGHEWDDSALTLFE
jgi:hypothetical protein